MLADTSASASRLPKPVPGINGTGATVTIQVKVWADGQEEPADWTVEYSDTSASRITAAGWVGVGRSEHKGATWFDAVGVGTNGDTAPIPAGTSAIRETTINAQALVTNDATPVRLTTINAQALMKNDATPVRLSTINAQVMYTIRPPRPQTVVCVITQDFNA